MPQSRNTSTKVLTSEPPKGPTVNSKGQQSRQDLRWLAVSSHLFKKHRPELGSKLPVQMLFPRMPKRVMYRGEVRAYEDAQNDAQISVM